MAFSSPKDAFYPPKPIYPASTKVGGGAFKPRPPAKSLPGRGGVLVDDRVLMAGWRLLDGPRQVTRPGGCHSGRTLRRR